MCLFFISAIKIFSLFWFYTLFLFHSSKEPIWDLNHWSVNIAIDWIASILCFNCSCWQSGWLWNIEIWRALNLIRVYFYRYKCYVQVMVYNWIGLTSNSYQTCTIYLTSCLPSSAWFEAQTKLKYTSCSGNSQIFSKIASRTIYSVSKLWSCCQITGV